MLSEDTFHQRGITLLYRTSNLIIQSGLYGKLLLLTIPRFYSILHTCLGIYASLIPVSTFIMM